MATGGEDDYHWLREKDDPGGPRLPRGRERLHRRSHEADGGLPGGALPGDARADQGERSSVPYRQGGYFYYSRTEKGKQYPILCRQAGSLDAPEEVILDLNALAEGHPFLAVGAYAVSDDGNLLAYSVDITGFREYTLYVKDLRDRRAPAGPRSSA